MQNSDFISEKNRKYNPRLACLFLVDTSGSMHGEPIDELTNGLNQFILQVCEDKETRKYLDIAIVEFNSNVRVIQAFVSVEKAQSVSLVADGGTDMIGGLNTAIGMIEAQTRSYIRMGVPPYTPWLVMITDGFSTSDYDLQDAIVERIRSLDQERKLRVVSLAVEDADINLLKRLSSKNCLFQIKGYEFSAFFDIIHNMLDVNSYRRNAYDGPEKQKRTISQSIIRQLNNENDSWL